MALQLLCIQCIKVVHYVGNHVIKAVSREQALFHSLVDPAPGICDQQPPPCLTEYLGGVLNSCSLLAVLVEPRRSNLMQVAQRLQQDATADCDAGIGAHRGSPPNDACGCFTCFICKDGLLD